MQMEIDMQFMKQQTYAFCSNGLFKNEKKQKLKFANYDD